MSSESSVGARDVDLEVGVVEDVLLALLHGRRGRGRQRRLGLAGLRLGGRLGRLAAADLMRLELVVRERGQLDRVVMAQVEAARRLKIDAGVAGPRQVDAREVRVGGRDVRVARRRSGVDSNSSLASRALELEVAARLGLQGVDQVARGIELEIAVRLGRRHLGRRAGRQRAWAARLVSPEPEPGASG